MTGQSLHTFQEIGFTKNNGFLWENNVNFECDAILGQATIFENYIKQINTTSVPISQNSWVAAFNENAREYSKMYKINIKLKKILTNKFSTIK